MIRTVLLLVVTLGVVAGCGADGAPTAPGKTAPSGLFEGK